MLSYSFLGGPIVHDQENANAIDALKRRLTDNPNIIPFIGAGLSRPFGYPDWVEFLLSGGDLVGKRDEVDGLILQGDYESAMSVIHEELKGINYSDFLRNTFDSREAGDATWNAPARFLPAMPKTPIVTTNIDGALEQVFAEYGSPLEVIVGARRDRIRVAIEEKQRCLIKLHGDYRDEVDRILTLEDYERHYGSQTRSARKQQPFVGIVQNLLAGNSFLFLGFGMEERTKKLLQSVAEGGGLHSHWIVLPRSSQQEYRDRAKELGRVNVRTLWYNESQYQHIGAFLHWCTCMAAPEGSSLHRFYSAIAEQNYSVALKAGEEAVGDGLADPALIWNFGITTELAAREQLTQGKLTEGMQLLEKRLKGRQDETQSARELKWALSYALSMSKGADRPADVNVNTMETLSLLREALDNPNPDLLSDNNYQQTSRNNIADVLKMLCLLNQTWQGDDNEVKIINKDSLARAAWQAKELHRTFSAQATEVQARFRVVKAAKKLYYEYKADQEETKFREAKRSLVGRKVVSLMGLEARIKWYDQDQTR